jgi:hypothetical protein
LHARASGCEHDGEKRNASGYAISAHKTIHLTSSGSGCMRRIRAAVSALLEIMLARSLGYARTPSLVKLDQQVKLEQSLARHRGSAFFHGTTSTR